MRKKFSNEGKAKIKVRGVEVGNEWGTSKQEKGKWEVNVR